VVEPFTVIDLFAGAGGATQGLVDAGWQVLAAIENDEMAARTYKANHPDVEVIDKDIESVDPAALRASLELPKGALTLLKACPPCQGYSSLGPGKDDDPRNDLVAEVWKFVQEFRPRAVLLENVPRLDGDPRLELLLRRMRGAGYGARCYIVDAVSFGVPQRRRRLIVLAVWGKRASELPTKIEDKIPESFDRRRTAAGKALRLAGQVDGTADELHRSRRRSQRVQERIESVPVGGSRFDLPEHLVLPCHARIDGKRATAAYGRIVLDEPAPTMTTRCTTPACGRFIHPTENRSITLREAALLQTFPLEYVFVGGHSQVERQIGNAVPVQMAAALGHAVASLL
jgi:DNA (cytosine-5)-methyltransferase 1